MSFCIDFNASDIFCIGVRMQLYQAQFVATEIVLITKLGQFDLPSSVREVRHLTKICLEVIRFTRRIRYYTNLLLGQLSEPHLKEEEEMGEGEVDSQGTSTVKRTHASEPVTESSQYVDSAVTSKRLRRRAAPYSQS